MLARTAGRGTNVKKILIVEDELIAAYNLADSLEQLGYQVSGIAKSGETAIAQVASDPPDLILMDIKLKGSMTGIEVAQTLQQEYDIPVIYLTAFSDTQTLESASLTTPYGYLTKPAKTEDIQSTLAMAVRKHEQDERMKALLEEEKQLNELKSRFFSAIAHDLRNPLSSIVTSLEILQHYGEQLSEAKRSRHFGHLRQAIRSMTHLLEELLTAEQARANQLPFRPVPLDLVQFCREEILPQFAEPEREDERVHFRCQGNCGEEPAFDRALLRHILANLLSNAIKYSPDGAPVDLELTLTEQTATLCVRDRGIGIPPEDRDKLFAPFERATNVGRIKGTGIGLYIAKQAVERHQGTIRVESEVGVGTAFTVVLPCHCPPEPE